MPVPRSHSNAESCYRAVAAVAVSWVAFALAGCGGGGDPRFGGLPDALYATAQFDKSSVVPHLDVVYATRPNPDHLEYTQANDVNNDGIPEPIDQSDEPLRVKMDIYVPPNAKSAPQPLMVLIHGGGFRNGKKSNQTDDAVSYAMAGWVVATIDYRMIADNQTNPDHRVLVQQHASDDLAEAIRFLKANAATYGIDVSRVATFGGSAGGAVSMINAVQANNGGSGVSSTRFPTISAVPDAAVSTGATLIDSPDTSGLLIFDSADAPVLLYHVPGPDPASGATFDNEVKRTEQLIDRSGNTCDTVRTPDVLHTIGMGINDSYWPSTYSFLKQHLRLP